jgi:cytochrome c5
MQAAVEDRIKPVGTVAIADPNAPASAAPAAAAKKTPEEIVKQVCAACHQAGVLNAPKIGVKEDWEARLEQGMDTLIANAVNGYNAMPAKGGNPNLTEDDIRASTEWMLSESGLGTGGATTQPAAEPSAEQAEPAAAPATEAAADAGGADLAKGEEVYKTACFACHDTGAANAPKIGDQAVWADRIAQGMDTLVGHAINGLNAMPPKGGAMQISDEDIAHSVAFMVERSK